MTGSAWLLVAAVTGVGVLHTIVPDHWVPITLIARQRGWSTRETARAALVAGTGHVTSTLLIGLTVWIAGVAVATRFGHLVSIASSVALIAFGAWIALGSWREMAGGSPGHGHGHRHGHEHAGDGPHGPDRNVISTTDGLIELSIFESGMPARFRLTGPEDGLVRAETIRDDGSREYFSFLHLGPYWESASVIPEPHDFSVVLTVHSRGSERTYSTRFVEHAHEHDSADTLYAPMRSGRVITHVHAHRHGSGVAHAHRHDHDEPTAHVLSPDLEAAPPIHDHAHKTSSRTALLLILGSSPMVEGIPAFFAAGKYGMGLIALMSLAFAISTIATYVLLCVFSTAGLQRVRLGAFEKYGEIASGAFIAVVGLVFLFIPTS